MLLRNILEQLRREMEAGRRAALCAIVATRGSTPQPAGTIVCVDDAATMYGSLGGGCMEADVRRQAHQMLASGESKIITFTLDDDLGDRDGMICGGQCDVAVKVLSSKNDAAAIDTILAELSSGTDTLLKLQLEVDKKQVEYRIRLDAQPNVLIAGAGHISRVLARVLHPVGFHVTVIDDRAEYANADRFPSPVEISVGPIAEMLQRQRIDAGTYIVIVTRGHRYDFDALAAVIDRPARYVGMIGSRRKIDVIFDDLRHVGVSDDLLACVQAPIGIDIHAVTADEIALSIAAQLISVRRKDHRKAVEGPFSV